MAAGTSTTDESGHGTIFRAGADDTLCDVYGNGDLRMSSALTDEYGNEPLSFPRSRKSILPVYFMIVEALSCSVAMTAGRRVATKKSCARYSEATLRALAFRRAFSLRCPTSTSRRTRAHLKNGSSTEAPRL